MVNTRAKKLTRRRSLEKAALFRFVETVGLACVRRPAGWSAQLANTEKRDHGGNLDAAVARFGGTRSDWIDLSTGINPIAFPIPEIPDDAWTALPDKAALERLHDAARRFWHVPEGAGVLAVPGASAAIAHIPLLAPLGRVCIPAPTYNEHAASFTDTGWKVVQKGNDCSASVHVHPNNPDGRVWQVQDLTGGLRIIDESFCDVSPDATLISEASVPGTLILKSFGKFWGLAGVRLGFVIGDPELLVRLSQMLGPWSVAGPALHIGAAALEDRPWADKTRHRLQIDVDRLDGLVTKQGATVVGGTSLFRLYDVENAADFQERLAQHHIWSRIFPYNPRWLRLGLPGAGGWDRLSAALA